MRTAGEAVHADCLDRMNARLATERLAFDPNVKGATACDNFFRARTSVLLAAAEHFSAC